MQLENHPTVQAYRAAESRKEQLEIVEAESLKDEALEAGADDVGIIDLERETMTGFQEDLRSVMPDVQSVLVMAFRLNQSSIRSVPHSVANLEFKHTILHCNHTARHIVQRLQVKGIKAINMPTGFPYEAKYWPGKMWLTNDKIFAIEAGLGRMGWNRLMLHPRFGAAVLLVSVLLSKKCDHYDQPVDFNPCIECGLCVKVCPTGAVKRKEDFDFLACYSHNYRERLGGFQNWIEQITDSRNHADYRRRVADSETISMWQSLAIGAQTFCDRCMAVCPAGQDSIGEYLDNRKDYVRCYVKNFVELEETIYVVKGSDAEQHVIKKFPAKKPRQISNGIHPNSAQRFLESLPLAFQSHQSDGLNATYHFTFTGQEQIEGTVVIKDKTIDVKNGHIGQSNLHVTTDSQVWIAFLAGEKNLLWALLTRKIRLKGSPKLMKAFAACFPG